MPQERFDELRANQALTGVDESIRELQSIAFKCAQGIKERLAYITERRKQRSAEDEQKKLDFAAGLVERDYLQEREWTTRRGQTTQRARIEVWRNEVKQHVSFEKKNTSDTVPLQRQQKPSRESTAKRPHDSMLLSLEKPFGLSTPANKRIKTATQVDLSSSAVVPPTSSKKSIPYLSTHASLADENVFADDDRAVLDQEIRLNDKKNADDDHENHDEHDDHVDHYDADEDLDKDEDTTSEDSLESSLTQMERTLTRETAMVTVMGLMLPALIQKSDKLRRALEQGVLHQLLGRYGGASKYL